MLEGAYLPVPCSVCAGLEATSPAPRGPMPCQKNELKLTAVINEPLTNRYCRYSRMFTT